MMLLRAYGMTLGDDAESGVALASTGKLIGMCMAARQDCEALGIQGGSVRAELTALGRRLPGIYRDAAELLQAPSIRAAAQHYADLVSLTAGEPDQAPAQASELLPTLHRVSHADLDAEAAAAAQACPAAGQGSCQANGSAQALEHHGAGQGVGQEAATVLLSGEQQGGESAAAPAEISWDIDVTGVEQDAALDAGSMEVDWDIDMGQAAHDTGGSDDAAAPGQIDWDISKEDAGEELAAADLPPSAQIQGAPLGQH